MPYAQVHYPFDVNDETFLKNNFPADFIAEGLDQTRGWFYTLLVLSTSLFGVSAFNNVIVNGLVLAENGLKMSKKEKNYPDVKKLLFLASIVYKSARSRCNTFILDKLSSSSSRAVKIPRKRFSSTNKRSTASMVNYLLNSKVQCI